MPISFLDAHSFVWIIQEEKYIQWVENVDEVVETITAIDKEINALPLQGLEKEAVRKERINQGKFRELLLRTQKECIVCGLHNKSLLTASHIKPWSVSSPDERLDSDNGFMMCPSHDKLFDRNLISFTENGDIMISKTLSDDDCIKLNVNPNMHRTISEGVKKTWIIIVKYFRTAKVAVNGHLIAIIFQWCQQVPARCYYSRPVSKKEFSS